MLLVPHEQPTDPILVFTVRTLEELCHLSEQAQKASSSTTKVIPKGQTVVWAKAVTDSQQTNKASPFQLNVNSLYCHYCSVQCNGQKQWDSHCASEKHLFNVNSDKEHQWNYRQPPWGVMAGNYELCKLLVSHCEIVLILLNYLLKNQFTSFNFQVFL